MGFELFFLALNLLSKSSRFHCRPNRACRHLWCNADEPTAGLKAFVTDVLGLVASLRCRSVRMCCHSSLSSNCLLTIRPRSWPSPTVAIEGHSKVMAVAKGRLTRLPSGCSSVIESSHRNASVGLSLQCPSAMIQSRWRRAMGRPPPSQEPTVLRNCHVHEAMPPRD